jgi:hypothetical protein
LLSIEKTTANTVFASGMAMLRQAQHDAYITIAIGIEAIYLYSASVLADSFALLKPPEHKDRKR